MRDKKNGIFLMVDLYLCYPMDSGGDTSQRDGEERQREGSDAHQLKLR
jgi:hypothetical protein